MIYSSVDFLFIFLPIVVGIHFVVPVRYRNYVILTASIVFYLSGKSDDIIILGLSIVANYFLARWLSGTNGKKRSAILGVGVVMNLIPLFYYKYAVFFGSALADALGVVVEAEKHGLPLGISFFTFHALSYLIDIYRRNVEAQKNPLSYALYILLFPQLIAGPIVRYKDMAWQLGQRIVRRADLAEGAQRFIVGLGKKCLLADPLGGFADRVFAVSAMDISTPMAWAGLIAYSLQIYLDFSGYSDMAIGLCRIFGFRIPENFNFPYQSRSIREFWRRWHISLSSFFRDYLYLPLGGNRQGSARTFFNLVSVFVLCGLWHGANWTFIVWGLYHGLFITLEHFTKGRSAPLSLRPFAHVYLLVVVSFGWVLFRSPDLAYAFGYYQALLGAGSVTPSGLLPNFDLYQWNFWLVMLVGAACCFQWRIGSALAASGHPARYVALYGLFFVALIKASGSDFDPFIYFSF